MSFEPRLPDDGVNVTSTHPLREAALLIAGVLGVVAVVALVLALAVEAVVPLIPPDFEAKLFGGFGFSAEPAEGETDARDAELQRVLDRLAQHWAENPYALRAQVLDDPMPNAFAFPGGGVVVTTGLLDGIESENELAFVLGHELGHFVHRDHLRGIGRGIAVSLVLAAVGAGGIGSAGELAGVAGTLAARSFDREQERAADAFALELVAAEYGHVAGAAAFFRDLPDAGAGAGRGARLAGWLSTHPLSDDRIGTLRELAEARGWSATGPVSPLAEALR